MGAAVEHHPESCQSTPSLPPRHHSHVRLHAGRFAALNSVLETFRGGTRGNRRIDWSQKQVFIAPCGTPPMRQPHVSPTTEKRRSACFNITWRRDAPVTKRSSDFSEEERRLTMKELLRKKEKKTVRRLSHGNVNTRSQAAPSNGGNTRCPV